ncbi:hypothetical protein [Bifidobacterium aquikefiri]|uniref:hypothetical protein n=1 Tax=Bifidobacterium aquikefiri TaxID=1653207 RepID=UPI0039EA4A23
MLDLSVEMSASTTVISSTQPTFTIIIASQSQIPELQINADSAMIQLPGLDRSMQQVIAVEVPKEFDSSLLHAQILEVAGSCNDARNVGLHDQIFERIPKTATISSLAQTIVAVLIRFRLLDALLNEKSGLPAPGTEIQSGETPRCLDADSARVAKPKSHAKARHRWSKEVSALDFHINHEGVQANVRWVARNQMLIRKGASMVANPPLNKDGSLGFSARFSEQLRLEHAGQFKDFVTTEDIIVRSVNEVGLFLYFGGTNSWLVLKDDEGKTIHDWTVVA